MDSRKELIFRALGTGVSIGLAWAFFHFAMKYLDPTRTTREMKKEAAKLLEALGIDQSISLTDHELKVATQLVDAEVDGAEWTDLGGCDAVIEGLKERVILPLRLRPERSLHSVTGKSKLLCPPKGVLFYGPPGCGKTLLAKALAREAKARFINLQMSHLTDKWYGETPKLAAAVFSLAAKLQPTIIFIDEIDHEATAMLKAQFMTLWDGFASASDIDVIVVGATNRPQDVDKAILRRMPARFHVNLPNVKARAEILTVILRDEQLDGHFNFNRIAEAAGALSGSDLKEICRLAAISRASAARQNDELGENDGITETDLLQAVERYRESANSLAFSQLNGFLAHSLD